jgi:hypothetical protein
MTNYKELKSSFLEHDQNVDDWLTFKVHKQGAQCNVGLAYFSNKEDPSKRYKCIYKLSLHIDYSIEHEAIVYKDIQTLKSPFFCRMIAVKPVYINPLDKDNPFSITNRPVKTNVLFIEYIKAKSLCNIYTHLTSSTIYYLMIHTLCIMAIAHKKIHLNHNDIHGGNICVKTCSKYMSILYVIGDQKVLVPTNGVYPVLIDYGLSHSISLQESNIYSTLDFYHKGTCPMVSNIQSDVNFAIVSFAQFIQKRDSLAGERFCINISNCEEFQGKKTSLDYPIHTIIFSLLKKKDLTPFLSSQFSTCIDILKSLIIAPVEGGDYTDLPVLFLKFSKEWLKIESQFLSTTYFPWILKHIVEFVNNYRSEYITSSEYYKKIIEEYLRESLQKLISSLANYVSVMNVSMKNVIESLIMIASRLENILHVIFKNCLVYNSFEIVMTRLNNIYMSGRLDFDTTKYTQKSSVVVVDDNKASMINLSQKQAIHLNTLNCIYERGNFLNTQCPDA